MLSPGRAWRHAWVTKNNVPVILFKLMSWRAWKKITICTLFGEREREKDGQTDRENLPTTRLYHETDKERKRTCLQLDFTMREIERRTNRQRQSKPTYDQILPWDRQREKENLPSTRSYHEREREVERVTSDPLPIMFTPPMNTEERPWQQPQPGQRDKLHPSGRPAGACHSYCTLNNKKRKKK